MARTKTFASIVAEAVSTCDRRGRDQRPVWRYLSRSEADRLQDQVYSGTCERYSYGIMPTFDLYLYKVSDYACVVKGVEKVIDVERTPELLKVFGVES